LRDLGHDPEDIAPWDMFQEEVKKHGSYGWAISLIVLPAILIKEDDWDDIDKKWKENDTADLELPAQAGARYIELLEDAEELGLLGVD